MKPSYVFFSLLIIFSACKHKLDYKPAISFYYWKSKWNISEKEEITLKKYNVKKMYVKLFDVVKQKHQILPVGKLESSLDTIKIQEIIPCVFIENQVFYDLDEKGIRTLANHIYTKIKSKSNAQVAEIHIDCDWSKATQIQYFQFLNILHNISKKEISCTIRLHQIKFATQTGIPPVKKAVLMCYNMGNLQDVNELNSIFRLDLLKNYLKSVDKYPIKLDIALPTFSWNVVFRNKKINAIINKEIDFKYFEPLHNQNFKCTKSTRIGEKVILKGDIVRHEFVNPDELIEALDWLTNKINRPNLIFYQLNHKTVTDYEKVFNYCNHN